MHTDQPPRAEATSRPAPFPEVQTIVETLPGFEPNILIGDMARYRLKLLKQVASDMASILGEPTRDTERSAVPLEGGFESHGARLASILDAHDLLASADKRVLLSQLLDPATGGWLAYMAKNIEKPDKKDPALERHIGYMHSIATAAGIQSGRNLEFNVPVWGGRVILPGLGQAVLHENVASDTVWGVASVQADGDHIIVSDGASSVSIFRDSIETDAPGWTAFKTVSVVLRDGSTMSAMLDHLNPYRRQAQAIPPNSDPFRLDSEDEQAWLDHIKSGMELLARDHPGLSVMISKIMKTIVPLAKSRPEIPTRPLSASAGSTIGSTEVNWQEGGARIVASTLVHEIAGHNRLNLEMIRARITRKETEQDERLYAPWRDDVRHPFGLMHGVVSFMEVANFWRDRARIEAPGSPEVRLAEFEVAHWREQLMAAAAQFLEQPELLTEEGHAFMRCTVIPNITALHGEKLSEEAVSKAACTVAYNRARWTAHHMVPTRTSIEALVSDWMHGSPPCRFSNEKILQPDPAARDLDIWAHMNRAALMQPEKLVAGYIPGTTEADVAYLKGDSKRARDLFFKMLTSHDTYDAPSAIVGLGFALGDTPEHTRTSHFLVEYPHVYRAVRRKIAETGSIADPLGLAEWLSRGVS